MFGLAAAFGRERAQRGQQSFRVMIDGADVGVPEQFREDAFHHLARGEHVGHAARHAQVIFQHHETAVGQPDQVGAHHRDIDVLGHGDAAHLPAEMFAAIDHFARNHAVGQAAAFVVDVAQKQIERRDALGQPAFDGLPFGAGDDARQQVVREDALGAFVAAIDGERDALMQKRHVGGLLLAAHFFGRQAQQQLIQRPIVFARVAPGVEHFIERAVEIVACERTGSDARFVESRCCHGDN